MKSFEIGPTTLLATGAAVGSLVLAGCGGSGSPSPERRTAVKAPGSKPYEACEFDRNKDVQPFPRRLSNNKNFCLEAVFPMGTSEIIDKGDGGEIGLVGLRIKVAGVEYNCVVPTTQPTGEPDQLQVRGEYFNIKDDCLEINPPAGS